MQDKEDENQTTLDEVALKVRENLEPVFIESLLESNSYLEHLQGIQELTSWYKKIERDNNVLEKILEKTINEVMKYLPQHYASLCMENVKINSKEKKQNIKFDINFQLKPIKSYVEFAINVNKIRKKTGRIVFEINSGGTIKEVEISSRQEKPSQVSLGIIFAMIQISITEIPFMKITKPLEICTNNIEIDLSQNHVKAS